MSDAEHMHIYRRTSRLRWLPPPKWCAELDGYGPADQDVG
jgi:hypothetical protein